MCMQCVCKAEGVDGWIEVQRKIRVGMRCGKSKDYFNKLLLQGCPTGRWCFHCGKTGKARNKGKGKQAHCLL
jgi:hypothetical protein